MTTVVAAHVAYVSCKAMLSAVLVLSCAKGDLDEEEGEELEDV